MSGPKLTESGNLEEFLKRASTEIERATLEVLPSKEPYKELYSIQKDYPLRGGKRFRPALLFYVLSGSEHPTKTHFHLQWHLNYFITLH